MYYDTKCQLSDAAGKPDFFSAKRGDRRDQTKWVSLGFEIFHIFSGNVQYGPLCQLVSVCQ
jgi:hypothetical protein